MTRLGFDPRTLSVLRIRDNQLHHPADVEVTSLMGYLKVVRYCGDFLGKRAVRSRSGGTLTHHQHFVYFKTNINICWRDKVFIHQMLKFKWRLSQTDRSVASAVRMAFKSDVVRSTRYRNNQR